MASALLCSTQEYELQFLDDDRGWLDGCVLKVAAGQNQRLIFDKGVPMESEIMNPIIIDLGKVKRKKIKKLKKGRGPLLEEVRQALDQIEAGSGHNSEKQHLQPVVFLYRKKQKSGRLFKNLTW